MKDAPVALTVEFEIEDRAYGQGIWILLQEIFTKEMGISLRLKSANDAQSSEQTDIYICKFSAGAERVCRPEFLSRKDNCLLIAVSDGINPPARRHLSSCLDGSVVLRKLDTVEYAHQAIKMAWKRLTKSYIKECWTCKALYLTEIEGVIADWICQYFTNNQIASFLDIDPKTVSKHRRDIMRKFNLSSSVEFVSFINQWRLNVSPRRSGLFFCKKWTDINRQNDLCN